MFESQICLSCFLTLEAKDMAEQLEERTQRHAAIFKLYCDSIIEGKIENKGNKIIDFLRKIIGWDR